jgi:hypothetical protein
MSNYESRRYWINHDEEQEEVAMLALGVLGLIHGFDRLDLARTAAVLADPHHDIPFEDLEAKLRDETGMDFYLTQRQWSAISIEVATGRKP